jgi:lipopolysaccharide transport system permease protein
MQTSRHVTTTRMESEIGDGPANSGPWLIIEPARKWKTPNLGEVWHARELLFFLTWREIKVRYQQTALGAAWALLQPALTMLIFTLFFGRLAHMPSEGVPYSLFAFGGLVPWTYFANGLSQASNSLVASANLVTKVYFPRLVIPLSTVLAGLIDFGLAFLLLLALMLRYGVTPGVNALWMPLFLLLAFITCLGVGLWTSALNVRYRDIRYVIPFLTQIWMFATPIVYPSTLVPPAWRTLYGMNPMVSVIEGFRWSLLGTNAVSRGMIAASASVACFLLISGAFYFRHAEIAFADIV